MHSKLLITTLLSGFLVSGICRADADPWKESYRLEGLYQYEAALSALNSISSDNELVLLRRGWLAYLQGAHSKSIDNYNKAIGQNNQSLDARLGIILPLLAQQRWHEAALNANKMLEIAPWNYYAHIRLMLTEQALKQWAQLEKHAGTVIRHYPSDAEAWVFLARAERKLGNDKAAMSAYRKVLELVPNHIEATLYLD